jgi:hypothetical protein
MANDAAYASYTRMMALGHPDQAEPWYQTYVASGGTSPRVGAGARPTGGTILKIAPAAALQTAVAEKTRILLMNTRKAVSKKYQIDKAAGITISDAALAAAHNAASSAALTAIAAGKSDVDARAAADLAATAAAASVTTQEISVAAGVQSPDSVVAPPTAQVAITDSSGAILPPTADKNKKMLIAAGGGAAVGFAVGGPVGAAIGAGAGAIAAHFGIK